MEERTGQVNFKGNGVTLLGPEVREGGPAPDFTALNMDLEPVRLSDLLGQVVILSVVPSVDTSVCATQTRRFNEAAKKHGARVVTISMDLPFAQKRFCEVNEVKNLIMLSDFKDQEFARAYGLKVKELGLLARAVYVIDREGKVVFCDICGDISEEPNYEKALEAAGSAA